MARALIAGGLYFLAAFAAGFVLGVVRNLLVLPRLGATGAVLLELPLILAWSWLACRRIVTRLGVPATSDARVLMGATALALLLTAEAALATLGLGRTLAEHLASYSTTPALLGLVAQLLFAAFPWLQRGTESR